MGSIYVERPEVKDLPKKYNFFDPDERVEELLRQYKKHDNIIVAVDFDDTVYDYKNSGKDFTPVHELLRRCEKLGFTIVVYTVRNKKSHSFITEFYNDINVRFEAINQQVITLDDPTDETSKIYYNVFLDDKAGLMEAFLILERAVEIIEQGIENKRKFKEELEEMGAINPLLVQEIINVNTKEYNLLKCAEEAAELQELLLKTLTKSPQFRPSDDKIIEEIGDVKFRLAVIEAMYGQEKVDARVAQKMQAVAERIEQKKREKSILNQ